MAAVHNVSALSEGISQLKLFALYPPPCLDYRQQSGSSPSASFAPSTAASPQWSYFNGLRSSATNGHQIEAQELFSKFRSLCQFPIPTGNETALWNVSVAPSAQQPAEHAELPYLPTSASTNWYLRQNSANKLFQSSGCRCSAKSAECGSLFGSLLHCDYSRLLRGQLPSAPVVWPQHSLAMDQIPSWTTQMHPNQNSGLCIVCKAPVASWLVLEMAELAKFFVTCAVQPTMTAAGLSQRWAPWRGLQWEGPTPAQLQSAFTHPLTLRNCARRLTAALKLALEWSGTSASTVINQDSDARILSKFMHYCAVQDTLLQLKAELAADLQAEQGDDVSDISSSPGYNPQRHRKRSRGKNRPGSALSRAQVKRSAGMQPAVQFRQEPAPRRVLSKVEAAEEQQTLPLPVRRLMRYDWRSGEWVARAKTTLGELEVNGTSAFMAALTRDYVRAVELNVQPHMMERQQKYWLVLQTKELQETFVDIEGPTDAMDVRLKLTWKGPNPDEIGAQCERMPQHDFVKMGNWAEITRAAIAQRIQYHNMLHFPTQPLWARALPPDTGYEAESEVDSDAESLQSLSEPHVAVQAADIAAAAERDTEWQQATDGTVVQPVAAAAFLLCGLADGSDDEGGAPPGQPPPKTGSTAAAPAAGARSGTVEWDSVAPLSAPTPQVTPASEQGRESPVSTSEAVSAMRDLS